MEEWILLVVAAQKGDKGAFGHIVRRFQNMAYAGAYAMLGDSGLAQDAAQEAFIDAYLSLPKLREPAAFPGWFRRIVIKHSDRQIRKKRVEAVPVESILYIPSPLPDPAAVVEGLQIKQEIHNAIAALPQHECLVTTLFYVKGYSQKEMAEFLELPLTTIKKRLYNARRKLKERILVMLQEHLEQNKPSQNDHFANKVQFFIALRTGDLEQVKALVQKDPALINVRTEWAVSSDGHYWPLGITPLYWAAGIGDEPLATFILSQGADVNSQDPSGLTPLHHAVLMRQPKMVRLLLAQRANVNAETKVGHTPLHHAVIRNNAELVELLITNNAEVDAADKQGYTPADWAAIKGYVNLVDLLVARGAVKPANYVNALSEKFAPNSPMRYVPIGEQILGRLLNESGLPIDGLSALADAPMQPIYHTVIDPTTSILQTGIKIIDLLAPLKRGGHIGVFTPLSGVGRILIISQLIYSMATRHDGYIVYLGLEEGAYTAKNLILQWRGEFGLKEEILAEKMVHVFGQANDSTWKRHQAIETGLTIAENFRQQGHEVLLVVESKLALSEGVLPYLKANATSTPEAAITTIYHGDHTVGLEPTPLTDLGTVLTFDLERARQGLRPAIDPLQSRSKLLRSDLIGDAHIRLASQTQKLFQRYQGLHVAVEHRGLEGLFYLDDRQADELTVIRARRLHRFLTQPLSGLEPWTGLAGQYVNIEDTIQGCQAIFDGQYDELPEEAFYFIGTIDQAIEKAKRL
jgi:RNA polymerase sigma factor (sigma-70 family)